MYSRETVLEGIALRPDIKSGSNKVRGRLDPRGPLSFDRCVTLNERNTYRKILATLLSMRSHMATIHTIIFALRRSRMRGFFVGTYHT